MTDLCLFVKDFKILSQKKERRTDFCYIPHIPDVSFSTGMLSNRLIYEEKIYVFSQIVIFMGV
jgi:hypothetical protein